jgi:hypothetical protein
MLISRSPEGERSERSEISPTRPCGRGRQPPGQECGHGLLSPQPVAVVRRRPPFSPRKRPYRILPTGTASRRLHQSSPADLQQPQCLRPPALELYKPRSLGVTQ